MNGTVQAWCHLKRSRSQQRWSLDLTKTPSTPVSSSGPWRRMVGKGAPGMAEANKERSKAKSACCTEGRKLRMSLCFWAFFTLSLGDASGCCTRSKRLVELQSLGATLGQEKGSSALLPRIRRRVTTRTADLA
ncbi:hypothetical protein AV530_006675 [Patagioenas fasciata monilis]|uniref:Uncharacterized protein n=1 Tax=Patagioenas fasciata monilis TaxID=372326 RepID=A0A1V4KQ11_PATFA|nr:hypothetical protein AV530_006675 [Patagioenas fasciata monilis]